MEKARRSDPLVKEVHIGARPETVFEFFTDPAKMLRWKGLNAQLEPRPGGIYRVDMNGRDVASGRTDQTRLPGEHSKGRMVPFGP